MVTWHNIYWRITSIKNSSVVLQTMNTISICGLHVSMPIRHWHNNRKNKRDPYARLAYWSIQEDNVSWQRTYTTRTDGWANRQKDRPTINARRETRAMPAKYYLNLDEYSRTNNTFIPFLTTLSNYLPHRSYGIQVIRRTCITSNKKRAPLDKEPTSLPHHHTVNTVNTDTPSPSSTLFFSRQNRRYYRALASSWTPH